MSDDVEILSNDPDEMFEQLREMFNKHQHMGLSLAEMTAKTGPRLARIYMEAYVASLQDLVDSYKRQLAQPESRFPPLPEPESLQ